MKDKKKKILIGTHQVWHNDIEKKKEYHSLIDKRDFIDNPCEFVDLKTNSNNCFCNFIILTLNKQESAFVNQYIHIQVCTSSHRLDDFRVRFLNVKSFMIWVHTKPKERKHEHEGGIQNQMFFLMANE